MVGGALRTEARRERSGSPRQGVPSQDVPRAPYSVVEALNHGRIPCAECDLRPVQRDDRCV